MHTTERIWENKKYIIEIVDKNTNNEFYNIYKNENGLALGDTITSFVYLSSAIKFCKEENESEVNNG